MIKRTIKFGINCQFKGGIGEAVAGELSLLPNIRIRRLVINELPRSGQPEELLDRFGISAPHIVAAAKEMLGQ